MASAWIKHYRDGRNVRETVVLLSRGQPPVPSGYADVRTSSTPIPHRTLKPGKLDAAVTAAPAAVGGRQWGRAVRYIGPIHLQRCIHHCGC